MTEHQVSEQTKKMGEEHLSWETGDKQWCRFI